MLIDSGSPTLSLPPDFYDRLEVEVKKQISIDPINNDTLLGTRLCYRTEITNENGPILTVHFEGADVELKPIQTLIDRLKDMNIIALELQILEVHIMNFRMAQKYMATMFKQIF